MQFDPGIYIKTVLSESLR